MSLEALSESHLHSVKRYAEGEIERLRSKLEGVALNGESVIATRVAGQIQQMRHIIADCDRQVRKLNGKDSYE